MSTLLVPARAVAIDVCSVTEFAVRALIKYDKETEVPPGDVPSVRRITN